MPLIPCRNPKCGASFADSIGLCPICGTTAAVAGAGTPPEAGSVAPGQSLLMAQLVVQVLVTTVGAALLMQKVLCFSLFAAIAWLVVFIVFWNGTNSGSHASRRMLGVLSFVSAIVLAVFARRIFLIDDSSAPGVLVWLVAIFQVICGSLLLSPFMAQYVDDRLRRSSVQEQLASPDQRVTAEGDEAESSLHAAVQPKRQHNPPVEDASEP